MRDLTKRMLTKGHQNASERAFFGGGASLPAIWLETTERFLTSVQYSLPTNWRGLKIAPLFGAEVNNFGRLIACQRRADCFLLPIVRPALFQILHQVHNNFLKRFHSVLQNQSTNNSINRRELFGDVRTAFRELRIRGERYEAC